MVLQIRQMLPVVCWRSKWRCSIS